MDRKEFLKTVWEKALRPILLIAIIFYCVKFLYNVFIESGTARFVTILILGFGILLLTAFLLGQVFKSMVTRINAALPESIKLGTRIIGKFLNYISPIILGMIVYHFWQEDWKIAALVLSALLIQRFTEIIKEEKQTTMAKKF